MGNGGDVGMGEPGGAGNIGGIGPQTGTGEMVGAGGGGYIGGDPDSGGGPAVGDRHFIRVVTPGNLVQRQQQQQPQFSINPNQVMNDIALGSGWGMPTAMPQMNPFSMYGNAQAPFNWGGYYNTFGGK